jgi:hypothetical protein
MSAIVDALLDELDNQALAALADKLAPLIAERLSQRRAGEQWLRAGPPDPRELRHEAERSSKPAQGSRERPRGRGRQPGPSWLPLPARPADSAGEPQPV